MNNNQKTIHYGWIVLAMGTLAVFGALGLARFGYSTILPAIQSNLNLNNEQAGRLATFNLAGYLLMSGIGGALASRYGARLVVTLGLALAGLGMLFSGWAQSFTTLLVWRCVTGIGSGAANIAVMGLWAAWFTAKRRGLASGIAVSGSSLALIGTGLAVPQLLTLYGAGAWRTCWFIFGAITLVLAISSFLLIRNHPKDSGLNPVGTEAQASQPAPVSQSAGKKPSLRQVYRSWPVWRLGLVYIAFGFSYIIYMTFFIKHLVADSGYSQTAAGGLFMTMGWFSLLCGFLWGSVSDRIGRRQTLLIIYLIHTVAFAAFGGSNPTLLTISAILFGLTAWSIPAIMAAICGDLMGPGLAPAALGFITLFFGIGQALGPVIAGAIADKAGSFTPALFLAAGIALLGAIGTLFLKKDANKANATG
ncbi:MAG TPA: MFS transporter [Bacillota bacterium]|nr:MFS transporter [Bacillota bacterium]